MSITQEGYFFIECGDLEEHDIRFIIIKELKKIDKKINNLVLNVVKNKDDVKLGYAYGWVDEINIYNLIVGLNEDGSERAEFIDDPDWEPRDEDDEDLCDVADWGTLAEEECPKIKRILEPLVKFSEITVSPCSMELDHKKQNVIFTKNAENWITEKILHNYFDKFEKDKMVYKDKNKKYSYPMIRIQKNKNNNLNFISIVFSPRYRYTACFVINIVKKMKITNAKKEKLIFFSQTKRK